MTCILEVCPFEGGWSVKLCDTGEVLFFQTREQAEREARRLAAQHPGGARVRLMDLGRRLASEWAAHSQTLGSALAPGQSPALA